MPKKTYNISTLHTPEHLFNLVADIESYPEFLPWVAAARILERQDNVIIAELLVKYKFIRSRYTSKVTLTSKQEIIVELVDGPFKHLQNHWKFIETSNGSIIEFMLDFELKSSLLEELITSEFDKYAQKLMAAFIKRAG